MAPPPLPERLGPYQLISLIGSGGMGDVYRARDTRLARTVAVKVLPPRLGANPEARVRFEREARAIASLSHPHVCVVHDVGREGDHEFIVMEHLEGESLAARLERGPLRDAEFFRFAIQITEGLHHAHAAGIVHRDIKPGNIMLTKSGAKLLDFGIAALRAGSMGGETATADAITSTGQVIGTLHYMAPEQLEGHDTDPRTDIFALGLVLYEMATGRKAFDGATSTAVIAAILGGRPVSICAIEPTCSVALDWAIQRCLARSPDERWQSAADLAAVLRWLERGVAGPEHAREPLSGARARRIDARNGSMLLAAAAALVLGTWFMAARSRPPAGPPALPLRAAIPLVAGAAVGEDGSPALAISPDGTRLVYAASAGAVSALYLRRLDRVEATPLPGTDGATNPFFAPDGRSIAFFAGGRLKLLPLDGSSPSEVCEAPRGRGGSFADEETIVFAASSDGPLFRVHASGGEPERLTTLSTAPRERSHRWPEVLPGGRTVLFTAGNPTDNTLSDVSIVALPLAADGVRKVVVEGGSYARYADGYLLYFSGSSLMAAPFDVEKVQLTGKPLTLVEALSGSRYIGAAQYAISRQGSLIYLPAGTGGGVMSLTWVNRDGTAEPAGSVKGLFTAPRLSPDARRVAFAANEGEADVHVYDLQARTLSRITFGPDFEGNPVWSPDGSRIAYSSERGPGVQMFWKRWDDPRGAPGALAQTTTEDEALAPGPFARVPQSWSPDGKHLAFTQIHPDTRRDIWIAPIGGTPYPLVATPFEDNQPVFSPDGRWIAYQSNDSGADEIYAIRFPTVGARVQLTSSGGAAPRWSKSGEIFYWRTGRIYALRVTEVQETLQPGTPQVIADVRALPFYDVTPDGERLFMFSTGTEHAGHLELVHQWPAQLRR